MVGNCRKLVYSLLMSGAALMAGCGGGGGGPLGNLDDGDTDSDGGSSGSSQERNIDVSVSGTSGTVVVRLNTTDYTFSEDDTITVTSFGADDEVQATIIASPASENCYLTSTNQQQVIIANRATVECGEAEVSGRVRNFVTNEEIVGATVSVTKGTTGTYSDYISVFTDSDGEYVFQNEIVADERTVITVTADGFAPYTTVVELTDMRPIVKENIFLIPLNLTDTEPSGSEDMIFRVLGIPVLEIPANGLVDGIGAAPVGEVTASITLLDPTVSPRILPGQFESLDLGVVEQLETYSGISFFIQDSEGTTLELAGGVSATLSIPASSTGENVLPALSTIFSFNDNNGYWEPQADATLSSYATTPIYEASVSDLGSSLMAGSEYTPVFSDGVVLDSLGNPYAGATVISQGRDYIGLAYTTTDEEGLFSLPSKSNSDILVYSIVGAQSRTVEVSTTLTGAAGLEVLLNEDASTITLTWGENPSDLDSHLFGPTLDATRFKLYYAEREVTVGGVTMFLDVDDVSGFGPEVTTFPSFPLPGTYEFYVNLFAGESTIQLSPARVELNLQGENYVFSPPSGAPTECWHVFNISVNSALRGTLVQTNDWADDSGCNSGGN